MYWDDHFRTVVSLGMPIQQISEKSIFALVIDYYYLCNKNCLIREYRCKHREGSVSKSLPLILFSSDYQIYILDSHFCRSKGGAKSVRRAKKSGNGRRLAPKTLRGRARARVFDGASAARSSSRFFAMRRQLCALRNGDLFRFEFFSSHLAGLRPAGMHCENSGSSDGIGASARSGCTKQRSLLCAARNEDYSFH